MGNACFVTGVSRGVGLAVARALLRRGDRVYGVSRTAPNDSELARAADRGAFVWQGCDVANPADLAAVLEHQRQIGFTPEVIVLNAGIAAAESGTLADNRVWAVNVQGALDWVDRYLAADSAGPPRHFVLVSSIAVLLRRMIPVTDYVASKHAAAAAFADRRRRFPRHRFTTIYLGVVATGMSRHLRAPAWLVYPPARAAAGIVRAVTARRDWAIVNALSLLAGILYAALPLRVRGLVAGRPPRV